MANVTDTTHHSRAVVTVKRGGGPVRGNRRVWRAGRAFSTTQRRRPRSTARAV